MFVLQVITEFCCNKMHKEADMAIVVILRWGVSCRRGCFEITWRVMYTEFTEFNYIVQNFLCSHGKDGVVYAADGQSINMEYIYEFFNNRCKDQTSNFLSNVLSFPGIAQTWWESQSSSLCKPAEGIAPTMVWRRRVVSPASNAEGPKLPTYYPYRVRCFHLWKFRSLFLLLV